MFQSKLGEIGADFPESLIKNLDRSIITMHPKYKRRAAKVKAAMAKATGNTPTILYEQRELQSRKYPGLSVPDQDWRPAERYLADRVAVEPVDKLPASISVDDTMAELEAVAARRHRPSAEDYLDGEPPTKRIRDTDYGTNGYNNGHSFRQDARNGSRGNGHTDNGRVRTTLDERPILYKIYQGTVQNLRDFGAFVSLDGVQGRAEGKSFLRSIRLPLRNGSRIQYHQ